MSLEQKQSVETMRFHLYERPLHPELFQIHHDHHVIQAGYEAQIWVTGCTHVIEFFREAQSLVEVIAASGAMLPERGRLLELPIRGEREHQRRQVGGIHYMVNFQVETMSADVYTRTHHELARLGAKQGLFVPFPKWRARSLTPFSYIDYQASPNALHVFSFHAFPADLSMVKMQSIFELG